MKKILIALSILTSSTCAQECDPSHGLQPGEKTPSGKIVTATIEPDVDAMPIEYGGHKYIGFIYYRSSDVNGFSVVHDASCQNPVHEKADSKNNDSYFDIW